MSNVSLISQKNMMGTASGESLHEEAALELVADRSIDDK